MKMCKLCQQFYREYPPQEEDAPFEEGKKRKIHRISNNYTSALKECAFQVAKKFSTNNWGCQTMIELRDLCGESIFESKDYSFYWRDDMFAGTLGVLPIPEPHGKWVKYEDKNIQQGYLVMAWYKSRGRTSNAWVITEGEGPKPLNLETAEYLIDYYSEENEKDKEE